MYKWFLKDNSSHPQSMFHEMGGQPPEGFPHGATEETPSAEALAWLKTAMDTELALKESVEARKSAFYLMRTVAVVGLKFVPVWEVP